MKLFVVTLVRKQCDVPIQYSLLKKTTPRTFRFRGARTRVHNPILGDFSADVVVSTHTSPRSNLNNLTGLIWLVKSFTSYFSDFLP